MAITKVAETTFTVAIGTGSENKSLPGTPLENDIVLVGIASDQSFSVGGGDILTSGYADITNPGTQNPANRLAYKRMGSTPDSAVLIHQNDNRVIAGLIQIWRGVDTTTAIDNTPTTATGSSGAPNAPSFTTVTANALVFAWGAIDDDDVAGSAAAPSGYTTDFLAADTGQASTAEGATCYLGSAVKASPGAEDPGAFSGGDDAWEACTFALRPALPAIDGTLSATLGAATVTATGALAIAGTLSATLAAATLYSVETIPDGTLSATLGDATLTGTGALAISGSLSATLEDAAIFAFESTASEGSVTVTLGAVTMTSESIYSPPPPGIDDYPPIIPAVASGGTLTPEMVEWLRQLVDEVRELRAASNDYETRISDLEP